MSDYLDRLEAEVIDAVCILERERYYENTPPLLEMIRLCKHYQRITEAVLGGHSGMSLESNEREFNRAHEERDWYRYPESPQRPCAEIENGPRPNTSKEG